MRRLGLRQRVAAECIGSAFLVAAVVGSGIMGERLAGGNVAIALLANTIATGAALVALILALGPISGAHLNPAVSLMEAWRGTLPWGEASAYMPSQMAGGAIGAIAANVMFGVGSVSLSHHARSGPAQVFSEFVATLGLLVVIGCCSRFQPKVVSVAVGGYIAAAYWFTASTSFANPAVTIARALSDTFAGIRPSDVPGFIAAQLVGAVAATTLLGWLVPIKVQATAAAAPLESAD
ncbi:MAG TPA: MIP/aquaporin family protein [Candidatus Aquilonibacter sp.]|nr:MIP/aquaporin family protein [Candidatus Aquilonibacter sp.]